MIAHHASSSNSAVTSSNTAVTLTLPTITANVLGILNLTYNALVGTVAVSTPPSGWTLQGTQSGVGVASKDTCLVYTKALTSADSGGTVTATMASGVRWSIACSTYSGVLAFDALTGNNSNTTDFITIPLPAITPVAAGCLRVGVLGLRANATAVTITATPPASWNLRTQAGTSTVTANSNTTAAIMDIQLTGQAGVAQAVANATVDNSSVYAVHSLTLSPAVTATAGPSGETLTSALNRVAGTTGLNAQGAAQVWANAPGMDLLGALNKKAGTSGLGLNGVLNQLAGTTALDAWGAADSLLA